MRLLLPALAVLLVAPQLGAATIYVAPPPLGDDARDGNEMTPVATMARAQELAQAGDTVYFRAGTYAFAQGTSTCSSGTATISAVVLDKSGVAGSPIQYFAYPGELPVFDFDGIRDSCRIRGIMVSASYVHIRGLEIKGVRQNNDLNHESWGVWNQGSHNVFEALDVHNVMGAGIFIQHGSDNLVLNCDSHHNFDEHTSNGAGESADGFGCHVGVGETGNVFRGCRAWWNADDGYDFINAGAACQAEYSWAWLNGYKPDTMDGIGNGNGFKGGGYGTDPANFPAKIPAHTVHHCLAFANKAAGFYANHHPGVLFFYNDTSYGNHPDFNMLGMNAQGMDITIGEYRNNIAFGGVLFSNRNGADDASNSWTLAGISVSDADFQSIAVTGMDAPRGADGSLPVLPNFRLAAGSDLIDRGIDVGFDFSGSAPDLGAFELGAEPPKGDAGAAGSALAGMAGSALAGASSSGGSDGGGVSMAGTVATGGSSSGGAGALVGGSGPANSATEGSNDARDDAGCGCHAGRSGPQGTGLGAMCLAWLLSRRARRRPR